MRTYIALLRGVNVGGRNRIAMSDLRALASGLGFAGASTILQSGNLAFACAAGPETELESILQLETCRRLGLTCDYFVRSMEDWESIVERNPFVEEAERDPGHLVVVCLRDAPETPTMVRLRAAIRGPEIVYADGRQLYAYYGAGIGNSKLTNAAIEATLGTRGTARNWNTVMKLGRRAREVATTNPK